MELLDRTNQLRQISAQLLDFFQAFVQRGGVLEIELCAR